MSSDENKPGRDSNGRYTKGHSPNPKGRPKKVPEKPASGFDVIFDRKITLTAADGSRRELSTKQALQHATLKDALKGKASAINRVVKWLLKRERWIRSEAAQKAAREKKDDSDDYSNRRSFRDPENANDALQILGIAGRDWDYDPSEPETVRLRLEPWAVDMALSRRRRSEPLTKREVRNIEVSVWDEESISWPKGSRA